MFAIKYSMEKRIKKVWVAVFFLHAKNTIVFKSLLSLYSDEGEHFPWGHMPPVVFMFSKNVFCLILVVVRSALKTNFLKLLHFLICSCVDFYLPINCSNWHFNCSNVLHLRNI